MICLKVFTLTLDVIFTPLSFNASCLKLPRNIVVTKVKKYSCLTTTIKEYS